MNLNFITKRKLLVISVFLVALTLVFVEFVNSGWCRNNPLCSYLYWSDLWSKIIPTLLISLSATLIPFSIITYFLPQNVFTRWKRFAIWSVPLVVALTLILTMVDEGGAFFSYGFLPFILAIIYIWFFAHSLILIVWTVIQEYRK